jgi:general secretion pathway protein K
MLYGGRMSVSQATALLRARPSRGWSDPEQFRKQPAVAGAGPGDEIAVRTRWFTLELDVTLDGAQVREVALIDGGIAPSHVVARAWGNH